MTSRIEFANHYEGGEAWRRDAACRDDPADSIWFPVESAMGPAVEAAKLICGPCPVREDCFAYALAMDPRDDHFGIYAATTPEQRRKLRRKLKRKPQARGGAA